MPVNIGDPGSAGFIGNYAILGRLGSGGMGVVLLGRSPSGRQVAVKVVHAQYAQDEEFRLRFRREVAAARRVSGAFTAPVVDADPDAEEPWMATVYVPGRTLSSTVTESGPLAGHELRLLALGLVEALRDIHGAGVVHRDLKPGNVLMAEDGPRVIDFGISHAADHQALTVTGRLMGTPPFMSPEQFAAPRSVAAPSDVFSLGSLLVYAATGSGPFDSDSPYLTGYRVVHEAPALDRTPQPLRAIVERCLEKDPRHRPGLDELQRWFASLPDTAPLSPPAQGASTAAESAYRSPYPSAYQETAGSWQHHAATRTSSHPPGNPSPPQSPTAGAGTPAAIDSTGSTPATGRGGGRTVKRRRTLVGIGAVTALAAAVAGISAYLFLPHGPTGGTDERAGTAAASVAPGLPAGWRPWRTSLSRPVKDASTAVNVDTVKSGCVTDGTSLYCAGTGFTVARIDAATGVARWRYGDSGQAAERPLGVRDGLVYVTAPPDPDALYAGQKLVALDAGTGKEVWSRGVDGNHPAALFDGGILAMLNGAHEFVALDTKTGKDLWRTPATSSQGSNCSPVVFSGGPYGLCTQEKDPEDSKAVFLRLDPADGTRHELDTLPVAVQPLGTARGQLIFAQLTTVDDALENRDDLPYSALLSVNARTGSLTRLPLKSGVRGAPHLVGDSVYFVRPDGTVTAIGAAGGHRIWERSTQVENLSAPIRSATYDTLYFANRFGRLLALDRATGATRWMTDQPKDVGPTAAQRMPSVVLVKDAIVAVAGDTAFSVRPDRPKPAAS